MSTCFHEPHCPSCPGKPTWRQTALTEAQQLALARMAPASILEHAYRCENCNTIYLHRDGYSTGLMSFSESGGDTVTPG